jgi:hypothetical protein
VNEKAWKNQRQKVEKKCNKNLDGGKKISTDSEINKISCL